MSFVSQLCEKDLEKAKRELNEEPASRDASIKGMIRQPVTRCSSVTFYRYFSASNSLQIVAQNPRRLLATS